MKTFLYRTHIFLAACMFLCTVMGGCSSGSMGATSGMQSSETVSMSRVIIPMDGGQTIQIPEKMMADTYGLWHPLSETELKRLKTTQPATLSESDTEIVAWLPPSERDVMQQYIYRLTHQRLNLAQRVLGRADNYLPIIVAEIRAQGLPLELACLPMVESAFEPRAVSHAGAAGLWQLMPDTARRFGLTVTESVDERFDVQKSTKAAIAYLAVLYAKFQNWPLAVAAYNCGEGAMQRALVRTNTETLADLTEVCRSMTSASPLTEETLRFVPQFAAAVHIMTNSEKIGLTDHALLRLELRPSSGQNENDALRLTGRYQSSQEPSGMPARSKRIE